MKITFDLTPDELRELTEQRTLGSDNAVRDFAFGDNTLAETNEASETGAVSQIPEGSAFVSEFLKALVKNDCQCPVCTAEREAQAQAQVQATGDSAESLVAYLNGLPPGSYVIQVK